MSQPAFRIHEIVYSVLALVFTIISAISFTDLTVYFFDNEVSAEEKADGDWFPISEMLLRVDPEMKAELFFKLCLAIGLALVNFCTNYPRTTPQTLLHNLHFVSFCIACPAVLQVVGITYRDNFDLHVRAPAQRGGAPPQLAGADMVPLLLFLS
jgi:hypothetical protein